MLARREPLVERPNAQEYVAAHQHRVELDDVARLALERSRQRREAPSRVAMALAQDARPVLLHERQRAARDVNLLVGERAFEAERPDDRGAGRVGAVDERVEPAGRDQDVVVDEDNVRRLGARGAEIAGPIRRQVLVGAQQLEAVRRRGGAEVARDCGRRAAVDVDETHRRRRVLVDAVERLAREAEALAGHDDDRGSARHVAPSTWTTHD